MSRITPSGPEASPASMSEQPQEPAHHTHSSERPPLGRVQMGDLRRLEPINSYFGFDRGTPIDRYYIEQFLGAHATDIRGRTLEIADDAYTRKFGGERVTRSDILHADSSNPKATIVADLADAAQIPSAVFDCMICTQTLQYIYDLRAAVRTLHRILAPGGVLLATMPGISKLDRWEGGKWGEYWHFTRMSVQRLFEECFPADALTVRAHGNVLVTVAFLEGMVVEDLRVEELEHHDPEYEIVITARAVKAAGTGR